MSVSTESFFTNNAPETYWYKQNLFPFEKVGIFYQKHFRVLEGSAITLLVLSILSFAGIGVARFYLPHSIQHWLVPTLATYGSVFLPLTVLSLVVYKVLGHLFPADRKEKIFQKMEYKDESRRINGKLDILANGTPCLKIPHADDPVEAGRTHGYLVAHALHKKIGDIRSAVWLLSLTDARIKALTSKKGIPFVEKLMKKLPEEILIELRGIVEGYHFWCKDHHKSDKGVTVQELFMFHLIQEEMQINFEMEINGIDAFSEPSNLFGCTTFVAHDPKEGMNFMRLLDWATGGVFHLLSLVIAKKSQDGTETLELGYTAMVGSFTAMNNHGFALAMNVALFPLYLNAIDKEHAIPSCIYNTLLLRKKSLGEAIEYIEESNFMPLAAYHLTIADRNRAATIHLWQKQGHDKQGENWRVMGKEGQHLIRYKRDEQPLYLTNPTYLSGARSKDTYGLSRHDVEWRSDIREKRLQKAWDDSLQDAKDFGYEHSPAAVTEHVSKIGIVNNWESTHAVHMNLQKQTFAFAVSSNFVGTKERTECSFGTIFRDPIFFQDLEQV